MPTPDEQFEQMLRQFRPVSPGPMPFSPLASTNERWLRLTALAAALTMVLLAYSRWESPRGLNDSANAVQQTGAKPLTIRTANLLLKQAPTVEEACDRLATQLNRQEKRSSQGTAFEVLGKAPRL